jgi:hypothetical protein
MKRFFNKSRAITLQILNKTTRETQDAQLHILINIPVMFHYSKLKTFRVTYDKDENCKFSLSQGQ